MENNNNNLVKTNNSTVVKKPSFSNFMQNVGNKLVANTIQDEKRKTQFIANIVSAVSNNPTLQECNQISVVSAALQAEALHFPVNSQLGYCYLVPFDKKEYNPATRKRETVDKVAQFQIGYKGYIQLAIRSGQYLNIDVAEVKEGELKKWSPLKCEIEFIQDFKERAKRKTIGYVGEFVLVNGFTKSFYMSYEQMMDHANTYSAAFNADDYQKLLKGQIDKKDEWKYSSFWYKNFDEMAKKTVLRQLLSKWGIMSVELQQAFDNDMASFDRGNKEYVDSKEFKEQSVEDVLTTQVEETASQEFKVDEDTGEVGNDGIFNEFINSK